MRIFQQLQLVSQEIEEVAYKILERDWLSPSGFEH